MSNSSQLEDLVMADIQQLQTTDPEVPEYWPGYPAKKAQRQTLQYCSRSQKALMLDALVPMVKEEKGRESGTVCLRLLVNVSA